jgi:hypothetical protein
VAKTRRSKKPSKRKAPAKKAAARKTAAKRPSRPAPRAAQPRQAPVAPVPPRIELKKLREEFGLVLSVLASKTSPSSEVSAKLDDTRRRISQWMTDIDDICTPELQEVCGPDMAFPLP